MNRRMMYGKVHRAIITHADVDYPGSLSLDADLMAAAGMIEHEQVQVVDVDNGARFETYLIKAPGGSGKVIANGAAARLVQRGDKVIVMAYADMDEYEAANCRPRVVVVDENNRPITGARDGSAAGAQPE